MDANFLTLIQSTPNGTLPIESTRETIDGVALWVLQNVPTEGYKPYVATMARRWGLGVADVRKRLTSLAEQIAAPPEEENEEPEWTKRLMRSKDGSIQSSTANVTTLLADHPEWSKVIGYSEFSLTSCWVAEPPWDEQDKPKVPFGPAPTPITDEDATRFQSWLGKRGIHVSDSTCHRCLDVAAQRRSFHEVKLYLRRQEWDGTPRVEQLLHRYAGTADTPYTRLVSRIVAVSSVARIEQPGSKVDTMVILEGPQGRLKSTWIRTLYGPERWFADSISDLGSKDSYQDLRGKWAIEIAELDRLNKADANTAKQFLSSAADNYRPSYGRRTVHVPRQSVFWGSTNAEEVGYFKDQTGNRRFLPVAVGELDLEGLARDRDQIWAEALLMYQTSVTWWAATQEERDSLAIAQEERLQVDPWEAAVRRYLVTVDHPTVTVEHLLDTAIAIPTERQAPHHGSKVGSILRRLGWRAQRTGNLRYWLRPGSECPSTPTDPPRVPLDGHGIALCDFDDETPSDVLARAQRDGYLV